MFPDEKPLKAGETSQVSNGTKAIAGVSAIEERMEELKNKRDNAEKKIHKRYEKYFQQLQAISELEAENNTKLKKNPKYVPTDFFLERVGYNKIDARRKKEKIKSLHKEIEILDKELETLKGIITPVDSISPATPRC